MPDALRAARHRLAMDEHPDRGGSATRMQAINVAFEEAMTLVLADRAAADQPAPAAPSEPAPSERQRLTRGPSGPAVGCSVTTRRS